MRPYKALRQYEGTEGVQNGERRDLADYFKIRSGEVHRSISFKHQSHQRRIVLTNLFVKAI